MPRSMHLQHTPNLEFSNDLGVKEKKKKVGFLRGRSFKATLAKAIMVLIICLFAERDCTFLRIIPFSLGEE